MKSKSVTENLVYNILYQVIVTILPIVTTPYIARVLGLHSNGIHSYTESIVTYFLIVGSLGTSLYGIRKVAYVRDNEEQLSKITLEIFILRVILMIITMFIYIPMLCINSDYKVIYRIQLINIIANALDISWFYQGIEDFKKVTLRNLLVKMLFLLGLFILIKEPDDLNLYILMIVVSSLLGNVMMFFYLPQYVKVKKIKKLRPISHLRESLILFIPQSMNYVYALLDRSMLGWITNTDNVSVYDQAQRLVRVIAALLQSLGYVMMARITNLTALNDERGIRYYLHKSIDFTLFFAIPAMAGLWAVSDDFIPIFLGKEYIDVVSTLKMLCPLILTMSLNSILGVQILIPLRREKRYALATTGGAVTNVIVNIFLIPYIGLKGACISSLLAEIVVFIIAFTEVKDYFDLKKIFKNNYIVIIATVVMCCVVRFISKIEMIIFCRLSLEIVIGGSIYLAIALLGKNEVILEILKKTRMIVKNKIIEGR